MTVRPAPVDSGAPTPTPLETLRLAVWFGLLAGLIEVTIRGVQRFVLDEWLFLSADVVWMAPVAQLALYLLVAAFLLLASRARGRPLPYAWVFATFVFLFLIGPLLTTSRIHWLASLALAVGVAAQAGRMASRRARRIVLAARRTTPIVVLLVVAGAAVVVGGRWLEERRLTAALPPSHPEAPNVLLLILDTVRADHLSLYGYEKRTAPHLGRLASRGVTFDHAFSTAPWTLTAHASLFTGLYPNEMSADWQAPLGDEAPTLAERLVARGYRTGGFVGNLIYATRETGLDRGFLRYEDHPVSVAMVVNSSWLSRWIVARLLRWLGRDQFLVWKDARDVNRRFLAWLDGQGAGSGAGRPFFAFLNYMDAHAPYLPPDSLDGRFGPRRTGRAMADLSERRDWSEEELRAERAAYDGTIAYVDGEVGYLLAELRSRDALENTLVIVTSDHGEQLGEHGLLDHGNSLYRPLLEVPLVVSWPGRLPEGLRVSRPVTLRDLPATVLELLPGPADTSIPGQSLARAWRQDVWSGSSVLAEVSAGVRMPEWLPIMRGDMASVVHGGFHYILNGDGVEELYAYPEDRAQVRDLAPDPAHRDELLAAREHLRSLTGQPVTSEAGPAADADAGVNLTSPTRAGG